MDLIILGVILYLLAGLVGYFLTIYNGLID